MIVLIHVLIALSSLGYSSYLLIRPEHAKFSLAYSLIGLTLLSGTVLVVVSHSPLLPSCVAGLVYLLVVTVAVSGSYLRLARLKR